MLIYEQLDGLLSMRFFDLFTAKCSHSFFLSLPKIMLRSSNNSKNLSIS
jgi:hypothetical protein